MFDKMPSQLFDIEYVIKYTPSPDANAIINQIFGGVDIILVDPQLYPHILQPLQVFKDIYQQNGQTDMVKKCDFLIDYISEYPKRQQISRLLMNRPPSPPPKPPVLSQEQVDEIVDTLLKTDEIHFYPREELELILAELRKRRNIYQNNGEYLNAEKADHYTKAILNYGQLGAVEIMQNAKVDEIKNKLKEAEQQLDKDRKNWETLYSNLRQEAREDLIKINNQFEDQIKEIQNLITTDENGEVVIPPNFKKPSGLLLQLRRRQEAMVGSKKYNEAADIKDKADALEKQERVEQERKWRESVDNKVEAKRQEQRKALMNRKNYWKQQEEALIQEANSEVERSQMAIEHIKKNLKEAENAQNLATSLKRNTKTQSKTKPGKNGLPPLQKANINRNAAQEYRQRAILNTKIYTRPVSKSSPVSVRK